MEKLTIKNSELEVSRLCMGGCPMGQYGWGSVSRAELIRAVNEAVDAGINFFDSADTYGLGEAERTLSEALGKRREEVVIGTKFGVRMENGKTLYDNSPQWIRYACEGSLKRLRTDYIDLYQVHYRDGRQGFAYLRSRWQSSNMAWRPARFRRRTPSRWCSFYPLWISLRLTTGPPQSMGKYASSFAKWERP